MKFNARFPSLREMLVTLMPTEAGTMPLREHLLRAPRPISPNGSTHNKEGFVSSLRLFPRIVSSSSCIYYYSTKLGDLCR